MNLGAPSKVISLCDLRNVIRVLGASKSTSSEGLEPFDLREIGGQSRARELESVPLDFQSSQGRKRRSMWLPEASQVSEAHQR